MDLEVLRQLKKQKRMTNQQLSAVSGVPLGTVNKLMSGVTAEPKLPTVQAIARALGSTLDGIAGGAASDGAQAPAEALSREQPLSPREQRLLSLFRRLDERGGDTVLSAAQSQLELLEAARGDAPQESAPQKDTSAPAKTAPEAVPDRETAVTEGGPVPAPPARTGQAEGPSNAPQADKSGKNGKGGKGRKEGKKGKKGKKHKE